MSAKKPLGELLVRENLVNMGQLEEARKEQRSSGGRLSSALVKLGHIKDKEMAEFLGRQYSMATVDLDQFEIDEDAIKTVSREICEKHMVIPVSKAGNVLVVAFADPSNMFVREDLTLVTRCKIEIVIAPETSIQKAIEKYFGKSTTDMGTVVSDLEMSDEALNFTSSLQAQLIDNAADGDQAAIVKFVNTMLIEAIKLKCSDIHIEPYEKRLRVRFRIDGLLHEKVQPPSGVANALSSRLKIMSRLDIAERRKPQDGRLKVKTANGLEVDFRVSVLPTLFGEKIVMRLLDKANLKLDMTKLGFEQNDMDLFKMRINEPQGLVLVTGPTGSGKTTTLYSALWSLNDPQVNISTAEDPVEFNLDGINQVQVQPKIGFGFPDALRSFLRQDPDIILVGEIRDLETGEIAFKAASTGHLVLSTLHTNDAPSTISRLLDMGIAPYLITSTVSLIVAQRLAGRICEKCKVPENIDPKVLIAAGVAAAEAAEYQCMRGEGCSACNGSGVKGRVAIYELMEMSTPLREEILRGGSPVEIKKAAIKGGTKTLRQAALKKLKAGMVSLSEVLGVTVEDDKA
ncbi:MAG TPA: type IV-A pilus assembly ATPase PilB [Bdellovibrionales bacterium]|nr:type IV-A pilus assembly ATPase PilB [Bdellovibrionales bacterium]